MTTKIEDEDGNRHFPLHKPIHPKTLVHYVDLAPHRKKKNMFENNDLRTNYISEIKKNDAEEEFHFELPKEKKIKKCESRFADRV